MTAIAAGLGILAGMHTSAHKMPFIRQETSEFVAGILLVSGFGATGWGLQHWMGC